MHNLYKRIAVIALTVLVLAVAAPFTHAATPTLSTEEQALVNLINNYRKSNGLVELQVSPSLTAAAKFLSQDMADKKYFSHTDSQSRDPYTRMISFGYTISYTMGENIAAGYSDAQNTFNQWRNSPGHNANMLGASYKAIGIGRGYSASSPYKYYWTTDFGGAVETSTEPTTPTNPAPPIINQPKPNDPPKLKLPPKKNPFPWLKPRS
ncbi:MAG TPA: CAP domain-containing protein [Patescibacteria group bacterium]|nr:CAP domain-containing protein [Patescibacteria group bacterium]